eukprot:ANDGO_02865.mRNA.1 hypothetical protein
MSDAVTSEDIDVFLQDFRQNLARFRASRLTTQDLQDDKPANVPWYTPVSPLGASGSKPTSTHRPLLVPKDEPVQYTLKLDPSFPAAATATATTTTTTAKGQSSDDATTWPNHNERARKEKALELQSVTQRLRSIMSSSSSKDDHIDQLTRLKQDVFELRDDLSSVKFQLARMDDCFKRLENLATAGPIERAHMQASSFTKVSDKNS